MAPATVKEHGYMGKIPDDNPESMLGRAVTYSDPEWGWDHLSLFLIALSSSDEADSPYRIGTGENVPMSHVRMRARMLFLQSMYRLKPETTRDLITHDACMLSRRHHETMVEWASQVLAMHDQGRLSEAVDSFQSPDVFDAFTSLHEHIYQWQERYGLDKTSDDLWIWRAANFSLTAAFRYREATGELYDGPLVVRDAVRASVHDGKRLPEDIAVDAREQASRGVFRWTPPHQMVDVPVYLDDLKHAPIQMEEGYELEDEGLLGTYDPRTRTVDAAVKDLLPALEMRLRHALESIKEEDRAQNPDVRDPVAYRNPVRFERLVRYQVLGQSLSQIAIDDGVDRKTLREQRDETAALIGLTLRRPHKGGRPRKLTA